MHIDTFLGGPYAAFGGKDASRGLATFSVTSSDKEYDDLSDLNSLEMESVKEWEAQFRGKYQQHCTISFLTLAVTYSGVSYVGDLLL